MVDDGGLTITDFCAWDFTSSLVSLAGLDRYLAPHTLAHIRALGRVWKTWASDPGLQWSPIPCTACRMRLQNS